MPDVIVNKNGVFIDTHVRYRTISDNLSKQEYKFLLTTTLTISATSIHNITAEEYNKLGAPASHGCIRMTVADCKWIYDHCPSGTVVTVGDNLPAPFDRPEADKIPEGQDWDPTDPEIG